MKTKKSETFETEREEMEPGSAAMHRNFAALQFRFGRTDEQQDNAIDHERRRDWDFRNNKVTMGDNADSEPFRRSVRFFWGAARRI